MRYQDAVAFRQALEQRLKDRVDGDGAHLVRDRKRVAFDRLLARLLAVAPRRWLLKGGFALDLRFAVRARATKDVDIEWRADEEELLEALLDAASHDADDFFEFAIERAGAPEDLLGGSYRFRVSASLAGRPFETFLLDVGFRRDRAMATETLRTEDLLGFAGIDPSCRASMPPLCARRSTRSSSCARPTRRQAPCRPLPRGGQRRSDDSRRRWTPQANSRLGTARRPPCSIQF